MREAVGVFDVSHLGKATVRGPGARGVRQRLPVQRPRPDRTRPGAVHAVLRRVRRRGRRPHRVPGLRRRGVPRAQRGEHGRGGAPAQPRPHPTASRSPASTRDFGVLAVQGPRSAEVLGRLGLPSDQDYMAYADATFDGAPVRICRTGYTGEHGYELIPRWDDARRAVGRARRRSRAGSAGCRPASAPGTRCAPRWATRCTGRTCRCDISPVQARVGLGGRLEEGRVLGPRRAARREGGRAGARAVGARVARPGHPARAHAGPGRRRRRPSAR